MVEAIETVGAPLRLVLDDVNLLATGKPLRDLTRLIRRRPENLHLVLSSRIDPPVSLPRLRLEGQLPSFRAEHLRFSYEDAEAMLRATGLDLAPDQVASLHQRTEGWAAGLRLAAIALRRADDPAGFISDFSGDRAVDRELPDRGAPRRIPCRDARLSSGGERLRAVVHWTRRGVDRSPGCGPGASTTWDARRR